MKGTWEYETKMLLNTPGLGLNCSCRMYLIPKKKQKKTWEHMICLQMSVPGLPEGNNIVFLSCGTNMNNSELRYIAHMYTN